MKSKTSFFNTTIFCINLKRFWPLWVLLSLGGGLLPIALLSYIKISKNPFVSGELDYMYSEALVRAAPIIISLYAFAMAMCVWDYLFTQKSTGFYHSIPVTRNELFFTSYVSGLAMMVIPFMVAAVLCIPVQFIVGGHPGLVFFQVVLGLILECIFFFSLATFCAILTSARMGLFVLYLVLNFIEIVIEALVVRIETGFLYGVQAETSDKYLFLVPIAKLLTDVGYDIRYEEVIDPKAYYYSYTAPSGIELTGYSNIVWYGAAGIVIAIFAGFLYTKRASENATEAIAFKGLKPVVHVFLTVIIALSGGVLLNYLFFGIYSYETSYSFVPFSLFMIVAGVIGYYAGLMLLERKVNVFRKKTLPTLCLLSAGYIAFCALFAMDVFKIEGNVPKADDVENIELSVSGTTFEIFDGDLEGIEEVLALHNAILKEHTSQEKKTSNPVYSESSKYAYINLNYALKNGTRLSRYYEVMIEDSRSALEGTLSHEFYNYFSDKENLSRGIFYERGNYKLYDVGMYMDYANWSEDREQFYSESLDNDSAVVKALMEAVKKDINEGNLTLYNLLWNFTEADTDYLQVSFHYEKAEGESDPTTSYYYDVIFYITDDCVNTLDTLEKYKVFGKDKYPQKWK